MNIPVVAVFHLPGSGRCTQVCPSCTLSSRPVPLHQAHEEHPRCCYRKPPAALDTVRNTEAIIRRRVVVVVAAGSTNSRVTNESTYIETMKIFCLAFCSGHTNLQGPVKTGDHPVLSPALICKLSVQNQLCACLQVTGRDRRNVIGSIYVLFKVFYYVYYIFYILCIFHVAHPSLSSRSLPL